MFFRAQFKFEMLQLVFQSFNKVAFKVDQLNDCTRKLKHRKANVYILKYINEFANLAKVTKKISVCLAF